MADVLPKLKMFLFFSVIQIFINLGVNLIDPNFSIISLISGSGISFIPFASIVGIALTGVPTEVKIFVGLFTGLITAIQTYLIVEVILSHLPLVNTWMEIRAWNIK